MQPDEVIKNGSEFRLGPWTVMPERGLLRSGEQEHHIEPMVMDVLLALARRQGQVVSKDELISEVWNGRVVADDALVVKIAALRQRLGDDSKNPEYIETIPRRGYRLKMPVGAVEETPNRAPATGISKRYLLASIAAVVIVLAATYAWWPGFSKPIESVAINQFRNLSDDPQRFQYIVDGFREELIISLNQVPDLVFKRGPGRPGDEDALVSGSVRIDGDRIRITVELVSADGVQIWVERFDGASNAIFDLQEKVANQVRDAILGEQGQQIYAASRPSNDESYDRNMRGLFYLAKRDLQSLQRAEQLFTETMRLDPNFGPAYLRLAVVNLLLADYAVQDKTEYFDNAVLAANAGVAADSSIASSMGIIYGFVAHQYGRWQDAESALQTASQGPTIYPDAHHWYSRLLGDMGLLDRSLQQALTARSLEPDSQILNSRAAVAYLWLGDMSMAQQYFEEANSMGVGSPEHHFGYTLFLIRSGDFDAARKTAKLGSELLQTDSAWVDPVIDALADPANLNARTTAVYAAEQIISAGAPHYVVLTVLALLDQADRLVEIAFDVADSEIHSDIAVIFLAEFSELHNHERFPELMGELGLSDYWSSIGCQWDGARVSCR